MKRFLAAVAGLALSASAAWSQLPGNFPTATVYGNSSAGTRLGRVETFQAMLDRALCSTANSIAVRTSSWVCLASANNGVLITSGAGVASISSTLPNAVQDLITRTGTLVSGATGAGFTVALGTSTITGTLGVGNGGTGLAVGTSGGIPFFSGTTTIASSALLAANQIMLGGGAGTTPATLGSLGTTTTLLHGNAAGAPTFGAVVSADMNITTTSCTNQFVTAISAGGVGTCTTVTLAGAQFANQGTTTTVLHGNAAGNPSFGSVSVSDMSTMAANTVLSNWTAGTAAVVANTWPSCAADGSHALTYTNGTGVVCTVIAAGTGDVSAAAAIRDNSLVRGDGGAKGVQESPIDVADTTGALTRNGGGGIIIQGTNTNDSAAAGNVGEYISSGVASASAVSLTSNVAANVTSITLTAGDWDVTIDAKYVLGATTAATNIITGPGVASATLPSDTTAEGRCNLSVSFTASTTPTMSCGPQRFTCTASSCNGSGVVIIYMVVRAGFTVSTVDAFGIIRARRMR